MSQKRFQGIAIGLLTLALALTLTSTVRADGGEAESRATVNGYQITLIFTEPAKVGENKFHVQITDAMGMPVTMAEVEITAMVADNMSKHDDSPASPAAGVDSMSGMSDAHGTHALTPPTDTNMSGMTMPTEPSAHETHTSGHAESAAAEHAETITSALKPGVEEGEYAGEISLDKSGAWTFNVHFILHGELTEAEIPVAVVEAGRNYGVLAGFFGFNASVIIVAAMLKRKAALA